MAISKTAEDSLSASYITDALNITKWGDDRAWQPPEAAVDCSPSQLQCGHSLQKEARPVDQSISSRGQSKLAQMEFECFKGFIAVTSCRVPPSFPGLAPDFAAFWCGDAAPGRFHGLPWIHITSSEHLTRWRRTQLICSWGHYPSIRMYARLHS